MTDIKDDDYWREKLTPEEFQVCRMKGTERAFAGEYWDEKRTGLYVCRCCGEPLFQSNTKYDSGSGWPSFFQPVSDDCIAEERDSSHGMERVEILCQRCDSHLGHVFPDGPAPTGLRYCVNSLSIKLEAKAD
ncbi:MAG: peptide-methionine (R)-S-oxide reductase MsrB [Cellvibrionaceae bacterium]